MAWASENQNLPAFVVLPEGAYPQGGAANWSSGFLPAHFQGTPLREHGSPILDLVPAYGVTREAQRANLDLLGRAERGRRRPPSAPRRSRRADGRLRAGLPHAGRSAGHHRPVARKARQTLDLYGIGQPETDSFGRRCLLARKLVQAGVRFVQLFEAGWDSHDYLERAHTQRIKAIDRPIAALIGDLKRLGLLESTLVVWGGEFGRSPDNGIRGGGQVAGRDHNAKAMCVWLAGGGVKAGHVDRRDRRAGQRRRRMRPPRPRFPRHAPAPPGPGRQQADLLPRRPLQAAQPDGRPGDSRAGSVALMRFKLAS